MLFPVVSESIQRNPPEVTGEKIRASLRALFLLLVPGTLLIAATSTDLLTLLYSRSYVEAAPSLSILVIGLALATIFVVLASALNAAGKPLLSMALAGAGIVGMALSSSVLVPHYALVGAALATGIGGAIAAIPAYALLSRFFPHIAPWLSIGKIFLAALAMYLAHLLLALPAPLLPLSYLILGVVYAGALFLLGEITADEIVTMKRAFARRAPLAMP